MRKYLIHMKKLFILLAVIVVTSCGKLADLLDNSSSDDPTSADVIDILENSFWGTAGSVVPRAYQEMILFHVTLSEGEEYNESAVTDVIFKDNTVTFVFPGGGWRTTRYTYDENTKIMKFDKPLIYATQYLSSDNGEDIYECRFVRQRLFGVDHISLFDVAVDDWQDVELEKGQWRLSLAPMDERQNKKLHEMNCIYGTSINPQDLKIEGGASWAYYNVDSDRQFPRTDLDLGEIYFGLKYTLPTEEQARKLIDNSNTYKGVDYVVIGNEEGSIEFPKPANPGEELGFWLKDGAAVVYSYDDAETVTFSVLPSTETADRKFCVRPVLK